MKNQRKSILVLAVIVAFLGLGLFLPGLISAGNLEPSSPPGSTMHTLDEIYNKLDQLVSGSEYAPVERTGQTGCWDRNGNSITCTGTGQDGELQKGVIWPDPRFTDNGDGTVTDNLTGLIWLKNASCFGTRAWEIALSDCNSLNSGECGLTDGSVEGDWRLPNVKELLSLIDFSEYSPALPSGQPFTTVNNYYYWSSTSNEEQPLTARVVYMDSGNVYSYDKDSTFNYVWPVRGGN
jgi:hypothetical protein